MPRMTLNDRPVEFDLDPNMPLLYALREAANLTGTKSCGGRLVTTIEGLSADRSHPMQQAMVAEQAIQCGYCTPGIVIAGAALLQRNSAPSKDEIEAALSNMCRCGVYPRLVRAVQRAGRVIQRRESISAAPAPGIEAADAAARVPALTVPPESDIPEDDNRSPL